jgi:hypothetical protein
MPEIYGILSDRKAVPMSSFTLDVIFFLLAERDSLTRLGRPADTVVSLYSIDMKFKVSGIRFIFDFKIVFIQKFLKWRLSGCTLAQGFF